MCKIRENEILKTKVPQKTILVRYKKLIRLKLFVNVWLDTWWLFDYKSKMWNLEITKDSPKRKDTQAGQLGEHFIQTNHLYKQRKLII